LSIACANDTSAPKSVTTRCSDLEQQRCDTLALAICALHERIGGTGFGDRTFAIVNAHLRTDATEEFKGPAVAA